MVEQLLGSGLTADQLAELAERLANKRHELQERVADFEKEMTVKDDCSLADMADAGSLQENRLRARGMVEQHQSIIREIDAAMRRMENGNYGISETTGAPIPYDRLKLIPWARIGGEE